MKDPYSAIESRIQQACEAAKQRKNAKIAALAREFDVPPSRLRARLQGRPARSDRTITTKRLDVAQEAALIRWINRLDSLHVPPTPQMIEWSANAMLKRSNGSSESSDKSDKTLLGNAWVYRFIQRLPSEWKLVQQKPIDTQRIQAEEIGFLQQWYDVFEGIVARISPSNIYNFDETGFALGQGKSQKVVTKNPHRSRIESHEYCENLTAIECISADGWAMTPFFIAKGEHHLERWYEASTLPDDYRIALSSSGYSSDTLAFEWLQLFHLKTRSRTQKGQKRVLLFDGHGSHLTFEFLEFCERKDILPVCFPPHTTHLVQPLDGKPFLVYKQRFRQKNNQVTQWGGDASEKAEFFRHIAEIREKTFKQRTIRDAFKERGIYPVNSSIIVDKLVKASSPTPELHWPPDGTPPPPSSTIGSSPPGNPEEARRRSEKLKRSIKCEAISPELRRRLTKAFHASVIQTEELGLLHATIHEQLPKRRLSAKKSKRRVQGIGVLTVKDANRRIAQRVDQENKKGLRKLQRTAKKNDISTPGRGLEGNPLVDTPSKPPIEPVDGLFFIDSTGDRV